MGKGGDEGRAGEKERRGGFSLHLSIARKHHTGGKAPLPSILSPLSIHLCRACVLYRRRGRRAQAKKKTSGWRVEKSLVGLFVAFGSEGRGGPVPDEPFEGAAAPSNRREMRPAPLRPARRKRRGRRNEGRKEERLKRSEPSESFVLFFCFAFFGLVLAAVCPCMGAFSSLLFGAGGSPLSFASVVLVVYRTVFLPSLAFDRPVVRFGSTLSRCYIHSLHPNLCYTPSSTTLPPHTHSNSHKFSLTAGAPSRTAGVGATPAAAPARA